MIKYINSISDIRMEDLKGFFDGWPNPPSKETHLNILKQSSYVVLAVDDQTGAVIGFINAISDNVMSAYFPLLEVLPEYRGHGIGTELVKRMIEYYKDFYMIDLACDEQTQGFYERHGLVKSIGMMRRNYVRQNCE